MTPLEEIDRREFLTKCARGGFGALLGCSLGMGGGLLASAVSPAEAAVGNVARHPARFWSRQSGNKVMCNLCPRHCTLAPGQHSNCKARMNIDGQMISLVYGKPTAIHGDPVEKGPFFHFLPGTQTLAVGTAGCNLHCKFCQNWEFTQSFPETTDNKDLSPQSLVNQVEANRVPCIIFTLNEPTQCIEYVLDTAKLARPRGIKMLCHTNGYLRSEPLAEMCQAMDAIVMDLKGFTEDYYRTMTGASLQPVLDHIGQVHASGTWLELANLVVPGHNDDPATFRKMCQWIKDSLSPDVPLFVSRFFPKYQLRRVQATSQDTLRNLRKIAYDVGLNYVYLGNMPGDPAESTYCPACGMKVLKRHGPKVTNTGLDLGTGKCAKCGCKIPGIWQA